MHTMKTYRNIWVWHSCCSARPAARRRKAPTTTPTRTTRRRYTSSSRPSKGVCTGCPERHHRRANSPHGQPRLLHGIPGAEDQRPEQPHPVQSTIQGNHPRREILGDRPRGGRPIEFHHGLELQNDAPDLETRSQPRRRRRASFAVQRQGGPFGFVRADLGALHAHRQRWRAGAATRHLSLLALLHRTRLGAGGGKGRRSQHLPPEGLGQRRGVQVHPPRRQHLHRPGTVDRIFQLELQRVRLCGRHGRVHGQ